MDTDSAGYSSQLRWPLTEPYFRGLYTKSVENPWPNIQAQPHSFSKTPLCSNLDELDADVAIIGMPLDQGHLGRTGARYGPNAIQDAPRAYSYSNPYGRQGVAEGFCDIDAGDELLRGITIADCANITTLPSEVLKNFDKLTRVVEKVVERGSSPVVVGGDHAITFPVVRGLSKFAPLNIVHFDTHLDYSHDYQGILLSHGSPIRRSRDLPHGSHILRWASERPAVVFTRNPNGTVAR